MGKDRKQTQTTESTIDPAHLARWRQLYDQAKSLPGFEQWGGTAASGMTPDELAAGDIYRRVAAGEMGQGAVQEGMDTYRGGMAYRPPGVEFGGYDPTLSQLPLGPDGRPLGPGGPVQQASGGVATAGVATAGQAGAGTALGMGGTLRGGVRDVNAATGASAMGAYMNPYEDQVVGSAMSDLDTARRTVLGQNADAATAAGAFGGSRHGVIDSMANKDFMGQVGDLSGRLRQQGFNTAAGLGQTDAARFLQAGGMNQGMDANALGLGVGLNQFNAGQLSDISRANAGYATQASLGNAGYATQASVANASNSLAGRGQDLDWGRLLLANNQFNAGAANAASQFNASGMFDASRTNASNDMAGNAARMGAAGGLVGAGGTLQNLGLGGAGALQGFGAVGRGITDANAARAYQEFLRRQADPYQRLGAQQGVLNGMPFNSTTTNTQVQEGNLFNDVLGAGLAVGGMFMGGPAGAGAAAQAFGSGFMPQMQATGGLFQGMGIGMQPNGGPSVSPLAGPMMNFGMGWNPGAMMDPAGMQAVRLNNPTLGY